MPAFRPGQMWAFFLLLLVALSASHYGGTTSHLFSTHDEEYLDDAQAAQGNLLFVASPDRIYPGRPTHSLFLWGAIKILGRSPAAYHALIVVLHALCAVLLTLAARRTGLDLLTAMLGGLLFTICVAHFRVVHWIACLGYLLALICLLGTFLLRREPEHPGGTTREAGSLALFGLACFSHPAACAGALFPVIQAAMTGSRLRDALRRALPLIGIAAFCAVVLLIFYADTRQIEVNTQARRFSHLVGNSLWLWGRLITTAFWLPVGLDLSMPLPVEMLLGAATLLAFGLVAWKAPGPVRQWAAWTILFILPFINSNMVTNVSGPSRHLFLASAGFSVVVGWLLRQGAARIPRAGAARAALGAVILVLILLSGIGLDRADALSRYHSGRHYISAQQYETGVEQMQRAILHHPAVLPNDAVLRLSLAGLIYGNANLDLFAALAEKTPSSPDVHLALGAAYLMQESPEAKQKGADIIARAVEMSGKPRTYEVHAARFYNNVGTYLSEQNRDREAASKFRSAIQWSPSYETAHRNLADALLAIGDTTAALESFRRVTELDPSTTSHYYQLGTLLADRGEYKEAIAVLRRSLQLNPDAPKVFANLGVMHIHRGELQEAERAFRKTLDLDPRDVNALIGMGMLNASQGDLDAALRSYRLALDADPSRRGIRTIIQRLENRATAVPDR